MFDPIRNEVELLIIAGMVQNLNLIIQFYYFIIKLLFFVNTKNGKRTLI